MVEWEICREAEGSPHAAASTPEAGGVEHHQWGTVKRGRRVDAREVTKANSAGPGRLF